MLDANVDILFSLIARVSWIFFLIYTLLVLVRSAAKNGLLRAGLELLTFNVLLPLFVPISLSLVSMSIVFVPPQETAVIVSVLAPDGVRPDALRSGLHLIVPFLEFEVRYPVYWQTYTMSNRALEGDTIGDDSISARTSDGQEVLIDTSVIFRLDRNQAVTIYIDWQERYTEDFIRPVVRGFVRQQVSQFTVEEVNSSARADLEAALDALLKEEFADKGLVLDQFLLRNISFTSEYASAVEQKQVALEGQLRTEYEAQQAINLATGRGAAVEIEAAANARAIELEAAARADALKLIADALATNDQLLTYSYIEKLTPNIDVMLLPADAPFLFPLPELQPSQTMTETTDTVQAEAEPVVPDLPIISEDVP